MFGHTGEAYGLVSDAYFDTIRKVGFVFMNNGIGIGYQTNNNSIFYTIEQEIFAAIENYGNIISCSQTVGFEQIQEDLTLIYPNPTNGLVNIEIQNQTIQSIKVYDLQGQLIKETAETQFDLSNYSNGTYFIRAQTEKGYYSYKLIKQ
jgi:hypothetical protein